MRELSPCQLIERSINKKYRSEIWNPFIAGIKRYELVKAGDSIAVCISGGKDSMLMAKLFQALHRHSEVPFSLRFIVMDPGYNPINRQKIESNAALLEIPILVFHSDIFEVVSKTEDSPCYLCARMRRGHLYSHAMSLGCNKIALGHHFSDVVETVLMNILYGSKFETMMPKLLSKNFPGMELIRPMYCIHEDAIMAWKNYNALNFIQCACPLSENCNVHDATGGGSTRQEVKALLKQLKKTNRDVETSIFHSIHKVNLDALIGYRLKGRDFSFLEGY